MQNGIPSSFYGLLFRIIDAIQDIQYQGFYAPLRVMGYTKTGNHKIAGRDDYYPLLLKTFEGEQVPGQAG